MSLHLQGNSWYLRKTLKVNGKSKVRDFALKIYGTDAATKKQAEKAAEKLSKEVDRLNVADSVITEFGLSKPKNVAAVPTLAEYWAEVKQFYADSERDLRAMKVWLDVAHGTTTLGKLELPAFVRTVCESAIATRRKQSRQTRAGKSTGKRITESTVRRDVRTIKAVFQRAFHDNKIVYNPWLGFKFGEDAVRVRLLMKDEEKRLYRELRPREQRFVEFVLNTGLRLEGARELTKELVITKGKTVVAHVSEKSRKHHDICATCGRQGKKCRNVPLLTRAQQVVKAQLDADGELWADLEGMASIGKTLAQAAHRAKIHRVSPHDLRHTFGHRWLADGGSEEDLSRILGHSSMAVTRKHYAHLLDSDLAKKMQAVMEPGGKPAPLKAVS